MARARNIKPSFFQNEQLAELDPLERLCFIGLWTIADYKGCLELRAKRIKIQLLPYDDCCIEKIAINLERSGLISIYSVQGQPYIKILNFVKHQNPHKNERDAGSQIPDIDQDDDSFIEKRNNYRDLGSIEINRDKNGTALDSNGTARADSLLLIPDSPILNPEVSATPLVLDEDVNSDGEKSKCPILKIIDLYHEVLPELRRVEVVSERRKSMIRARWTQNKSMQSLEKWKELFAWIRDSDFLMGRVDPKPGQGQFSADLEFIMTPSKFEKIVEGKYHGSR